MVSHKAEYYERDYRYYEQHVFGDAFAEVAGKGGGCYYEHHYVLYYGNGIRRPERTFGQCLECKVALQHIDGIFLEREDSRIVEHAEQ